jgi:hypothetical protein
VPPRACVLTPIPADRARLRSALLAQRARREEDGSFRPTVRHRCSFPQFKLPSRPAQIVRIARATRLLASCVLVSACVRVRVFVRARQTSPHVAAEVEAGHVQPRSANPAAWNGRRSMSKFAKPKSALPRLALARSHDHAAPSRSSLDRCAPPKPPTHAWRARTHGRARVGARALAAASQRR